VVSAGDAPDPCGGAQDRIAPTAFGGVALAQLEQREQGRPLRILFFVGGEKFDARPWESLFAELIERGHQIHLAFSEQPRPGRPTRFKLVDRSPQVTHGIAPSRAPYDGWRSVAGLVRRLADLARYAHPRYEHAPVLRERMAMKTLGHLGKAGRYEPLGRRLALRLGRRLSSTTDAEFSERSIRTLSRLEDAIPTSSRIDRYLRDRAPDVVVVTAVLKKTSQVEFLKSARKLRIPAGVCVPSWDNLTNKGLLKFAPERVFVWNEVQRREATELHRIPADRVVATGAQLFDQWFDRRPSTSQDEFVRKIGLESARYVVYLGSSSFITQRGGEVEFVSRWIELLRTSGDERLRRLGVVVRPHPGAPRRWRDTTLDGVGNTVIWPPKGTMPISSEARDDFYDTIAHSAAVVGINTTAMIEAAVIGKSVLTILASEFAQEDTLHFHYLLAENGGFLHVAASLEEHVGQLARVLDEDREGAEQRRRFIESFVRPRGLGQPATPILADAVEELALLEVQAPARPGVAIRAALGLEAALSTPAIAVARLRRRRRNRRRRAKRAQTVQP
jgi:hypothetical protein